VTIFVSKHRLEAQEGVTASYKTVRSMDAAPEPTGMYSRRVLIEAVTPS